MRIVIDLQGAQTESRFRGIGRYSLSIALAIARNAGDDEVWIALSRAFPETLEQLRTAFSAYVPAHRIVEFAVPTPVAEFDAANVWRARAAEAVRAHFLAALAPDVVLVTSLFEGYIDDAVTAVSTAPAFRTAAILYDLIPHLNPEVYLPTPGHRHYYQRKIDALKQADLLLAISAYSRSEAIDTLGLDPARVVNVSTAVDGAHFRPLEIAADERAALLGRFGIVREILMYAPGGFDHRKNFNGLIAAFAALPQALRTRYHLVIVSRIGHDDRVALEKAALQSGLNDMEMVLTGYVSDEELVALYNCASLFVFPSLHEGFGLPVLEAMACGAPVIGSATTSVPEVIGRADALFDPASVPAITAKLAEMLGSLSARAALREHGLAQAATFSWDRSGCAALAALRTLGSVAPALPSVWAVQHEAQVERYQQLLAQLAQVVASAPAPIEQLEQLAERIADNLACTDRVVRSVVLPDRISWRVEGPFDSSYSLALLNRETALALGQLGHDVALHSTEGPGDFPASEAFLLANPDVARLHRRIASLTALAADVSSRNLYPPRVDDMPGRFNMLHHYAWEESSFPHAWVEQFNDHLQGMTCLSGHVQKVMIDQGVTVAMQVSGCGVDHWERVVAAAPEPLPGRAFRFLHVSSCFPRKGADALLRAYGQAFSIADDVTLIIKTFANPHNEVQLWLDEARASNPAFPHVHIIEEDLDDARLKALMEQCQVLVAPSRAEGFGLPMAEAMLSGLAVITTAWGGQRDFCNDETAWLIDFAFAPAQTHFGLFGSVWAEPDLAHLALTMREVHRLSAQQRQARSIRGRAILLDRFRWQHVAQRLVDAARQMAAPVAPKRPVTGWISTWNAKCGIAMYSAHLLGAMRGDIRVLAPHTEERTMPDKENALRCWTAGETDDLSTLSQAIDAAGINTLVVQFNYGFYQLDRFNAFLLAQVAAGRVVVVMMHATIDPPHAPEKRLELIYPGLRACHRVLVHAPGDLNRLKGAGMVDNVALFLHGVVDWEAAPPIAPSPSRVFTLASYGFFLPHKGLPQLVEALQLLLAQGRDVRLRMINAEYPIAQSHELVEQVKAHVLGLGLGERVDFCTEYLDDEDSLQRLGEADLVVFPYQNTGESSSAAVRYGLASARPVAVTPLAIFDDVRSATFRLPGQTPVELAQGIAELIDAICAGDAEVTATLAQADRWRDAHRYSRLGARLQNMLVALQP